MVREGWGDGGWGTEWEEQVIDLQRSRLHFTILMTGG